MPTHLIMPGHLQQSSANTKMKPASRHGSQEGGEHALPGREGEGAGKWGWLPAWFRNSSQ